MQLLIQPNGEIQCIYGEAIDLSSLGSLRIVRASHVEPDQAGHWWVDLTPTSGPVLGPFAKRGQALQAERQWLGCNLFGDSKDD